MNTDLLGKKAALLSAIEIGIGSLIHGFKIPLGGHFLALNQGYILTRASIESGDRRSSGIISTTAAILKSLSPAGQKLSPMFAISMQGQLYGLGTLCFGNNFFGQILGISLLSLWGFLQPLAFYIILYGQSLFSMLHFWMTELNKVFNVTEEIVYQVLFALMILKLILAIGVVFFARYARNSSLQKYESWATKARTQKSIKPQNEESAWKGAFRDLLHPLFLLSLVLMTFFFFFSNSTHSELIWIIMRPIAGAYLIFLSIRVFPTEKGIAWVRNRNPTLATTLESAVRQIKP